MRGYNGLSSCPGRRTRQLAFSAFYPLLGLWHALAHFGPKLAGLYKTSHNGGAVIKASNRPCCDLIHESLHLQRQMLAQGVSQLPTPLGFTRRLRRRHLPS
jgi:hypothetical protein